MKRNVEMNQINYYDNFISYVKIVMEMIAKEKEDKALEQSDHYKIDTLREEKEARNIIIRDIYNYYFNYNIQKDEETGDICMADMVITTALFENKLYTLSDIEKKAFVKVIYDEYLKPIICNYSNGDILSSLYLFATMNDRIEAIVGYKALYGNNFLINNEKFNQKKYNRGV